MGLDFSHGDAHWAYSGFMRFRTKLAAEAGIALQCMESFAWNLSELKPYKAITIYGDSDKKEYIGIQPVIAWSSINDAIKPLLNHSDCDGELTVKECKKVLPRLRELISKWDDDDLDKVRAIKLADGLKDAIDAKEIFKFI